MTPLPAGGRSAITIPVLVAIAFVLVAGGIGASGGVAGESLSATNATPIEHSHDPATVSVDPAVQNAAGEVELILYLDSLSRAGHPGCGGSSRTVTVTFTDRPTGCSVGSRSA